jgi:hypothetical protein
MAADFVAITASSTRTQVMAQYLSVLWNCWALGEKVNGELNHMVNGSDYTMIESQYGLQPGQGVTLYNLVTGARGAVNVPAVINCIDQVL